MSVSNGGARRIITAIFGLIFPNIHLKFRVYFTCLFALTFLCMFVLTDEITIKNTVSIGVSSALVNVLSSPGKNINYRTPNNEKKRTSAANIKNVISVDNIINSWLWALFFSVFIGALLAYPVGKYLSYFKEVFSSKDDIKYVRGGRILASDIFGKMLVSERVNSDIKVAGVPLIKGAETQHIFISGDTGSGKGSAIKDILDCVCERNEKFIIYDKSGEYITKYFREGVDVVLNPFDSRMPFWSVWNEVKTPYDYDHLAASFVPRFSGSNDPHWIDAPRTLFSEILRTLSESKRGTHADLLRVIQDKELINELLQHSIASIEIDESSPEHTNSVKAVLVPLIKSLRFVPDKREEYFSLRDWVRDDDDKRRVFIYVDNQMKESVKGLVSVWLDVAISEVLSLDDNHNRRIWAFIDELASIGRLESISDGVIEGRKKGLCCVLSVASILLFKEMYGHNMGSTMASFCGTKLSFRSDNPEITKWLADLYGEEDVKDQKESVTVGKGSGKAKNTSEHRTIRHLVMPTEFQSLKDMEGFLKVVGGYPITKIFASHKERETIAEKFCYKDPDTEAMNIRFNKVQAQVITEEGVNKKGFIL